MQATKTETAIKTKTEKELTFIKGLSLSALMHGEQACGD